MLRFCLFFVVEPKVLPIGSSKLGITGKLPSEYGTVTQHIELKVVDVVEARARSLNVQELHNTLPTLSGIEDMLAPCAYIDPKAITFHDITGKGAHIREIGVRIDGKLVYIKNAHEHIHDHSAYIPEKAFYLQWYEEGSTENGKSIYSVLRSRAPNGQKLHFLFFHLNSELYQVTMHCVKTTYGIAT